MIEAPRQPLDDEIDRVATTLVAASGGEDFLKQVIARLPEREAPPWFLAWPAQLTVGIALVLVAFLYARPFDSQPQSQLRPLAQGGPLNSRPQSQSRPLAQGKPTSEHQAAIPRATGLRPPIPDPRSPIPDDHERSLAPVDAIESLELGSLGAPALEVDAAADLEPLVLTELPVASDPASPHER